MSEIKEVDDKIEPLNKISSKPLFLWFLNEKLDKDEICGIRSDLSFSNTFILQKKNENPILSISGRRSLK